MTALEVALLIIGVIVFVISFIFASKMDRYDEEKKMELTEKQKADIDKQVKTVLYDQVEYVKEKTEVELDKLSNVKMNEMNEYSETILNEINRNHNEVMFLYDMLNEKKKEVNNAIRDISSIKKELNGMITTVTELIAREEQNSKVIGDSERTEINIPKELPEMNSVLNVTVEDESQSGSKKDVLKRIFEEKPELFTQPENDEEKAVASDSSNNNEKILKLHAQGKSIVDIAKELGLGIGEVRLVVELFRGGK